MLDDRKKKVLQAIVEEYINTAEPVSSNALTNNEELQYSSATIRNEMAELEKMGYIEKTHTSSGRVPSAKGYRYYVDELLEDNKITVDEIDYISKKLETKVNELDNYRYHIRRNHYITLGSAARNSENILDAFFKSISNQYIEGGSWFNWEANKAYERVQHMMIIMLLVLL